MKTVENALAKVKDDKGMKRVEKFLKFDACPDCGGSRLSEAARAPKLRGITLDAACRMTLTELIPWVKGVPASLPEEMRPMAESICASFLAVAARLVDLGLSYLSLDRAGNTLSTGERQRMQIARAVRNRTTGVLYVLDEPSIGLHPSNIVGLTDVIHDLIHDGNSVVLVDHDVQILKESDWVIEMGPVAGAKGGNVIAKGTVHEIAGNKNSRIGPFLAGTYERRVRPVIPKPEIFSEGEITMDTLPIHTVKPLHVTIPKGRMTVVTGVSGSGKTTMVLESLIPGLEAMLSGNKLPQHVKGVAAPGIEHVKLIDSTRSGSTSGRPSRRTPGFMMSCGRSTDGRKPRNPRASKRATFRTTPGSSAAPCVTARGKSVSTCSSCRTSTFRARAAAGAGTRRRRSRSAPRIKRE